MRLPLIIDFETQKTFREVSEPKNLGISVAGAYDYASEKYLALDEAHIQELFPYLENASVIVGYNSDSFDLPVLQAYYPGDTTALSSFDILSDIKMKIGRRPSLNDVIKATLEKEKSGHGLQAVKLFNEGKIEELKKYCLDDVMLTKELFDYGVKHDEIYYLNHIGKTRIQVQWKQYMDYKGTSSVSLTLPF